MHFDVITLFPEMVRDACSHGVTGRAIKRDIVSVEYWNPRDETEDARRTVDDRPFGGGPGMVMMAEPLERTLLKIKLERPASSLVYLSPQGKPITQVMLDSRIQQDLILLCGRYEGIDERFIEAHVDEEWSLGDFVLSGGEIAAVAVIDAMTRQVPGVLGDELSAAQDSFKDGLLDCPHYTRPEVWRDKLTPDVLLSGHHAEIYRWRLKQSLGRTWLRRPDLLDRRLLSEEERQLLKEFIDEHAD